MRKFLWSVHSWLGLCAGLGLICIGLSGSLLVFHDEIEALLHPKLVHTAPLHGARLPLDFLRQQIESQLPGYEIAGWLLQPDGSDDADQLYVIKHGTNDWLVATLDPYTGKLLASPRKGTETFSGWMLELHESFFAGKFGMCFAGLLGVSLILLGISGVWIYREFWKHLFRLRWRRGLRILFSDTHKFVGITSVAFNLVLGFTGAFWNLSEVYAAWFGGETSAPKIEQRLYAGSIAVERMIADAAQHIPQFQTHYLSFPTIEKGASITLWGTAEPHPWYHSRYGSMVIYDAKTGAFTSAFDLRSGSCGRKALDSFGPLHFGDFGGLIPKIFWSLGGLTPGTLAVTGSVIWWKRRRSRARARAKENFRVTPNSDVLLS